MKRKGGDGAGAIEIDDDLDEPPPAAAPAPAGSAPPPISCAGVEASSTRVLPSADARTLTPGRVRAAATPPPLASLWQAGRMHDESH